MVWVSVPRFGPLNRGNNDDTQCTFSWVGPRGGLHGCGEDKNSASTGVRTPNRAAQSDPPLNKMTSSKADGSV